MQFRKLQNINDGNVYGFAISGPQKVWNISDITTATNVANTGGVYKYQSTDPNFLNEFIAFNDAAAFTEVNYVGQVANQNIRALKDIERSEERRVGKECRSGWGRWSWWN